MVAAELVLPDVTVIQGCVVSQDGFVLLPFFPLDELKKLRLWVDAASQNAWDTGKSYSENWMTIRIGHRMNASAINIGNHTVSSSICN